MRKTFVAGTTALAVAGALLITAPAADAASGRGTTKLHTTKSHTVSIAKTLRPGVVHLRNTGADPILIVRAKKKHTTAKTFVKLFNSNARSAESKALKSFDIVELAMPKTDSWVKLPRGTYYLADSAVEKLKASKVRTVTVKGHKQNAKVPRAKVFTFDTKGRVPASTTIARKAALRIVNHNKHLAFGFVVKLKSSVTEAQAKQIVAHPTQDKIDAAEPDEGNFDFLPTIVGPKHTATATTRFGKGRYFVITAVTDRISKGRVGLLTVR